MWTSDLRSVQCTRRKLKKNLLGISGTVEINVKKFCNSSPKKERRPLLRSKLVDDERTLSSG